MGSKEIFDEKIQEIILKKKSNSKLMTKDKYLALISKIRAFKSNPVGMLPNDYKIMKKYDLYTVEDVTHLVTKPKRAIIDDGETNATPENSTLSFKYFVYLEDLFDLLTEIHIECGHGCRDRMQHAIQQKYENITREIVECFLRLCQSCQQKRKFGNRKGIVTKPIVTKSFMARAQLDLIDMVGNHCQGYRYIMVYYDHFTKFIQVRALRKKTACEVAEKLFDLFTIFGAPLLLHTDNGREFKNALITELCKFFPQIKIVHGRPRNSQSQGGVERANQDVEAMLATWQSDNPGLPWTLGIKFVQMMKNQAYCIPIKMSPFEAVFSENMKNGLKSTNVPRELFSKIYEESDLIKFDLMENEDEEADNASHTLDEEPTVNQSFNERELLNGELPAGSVQISQGPEEEDLSDPDEVEYETTEMPMRVRAYDLEAESIMRMKKSKEASSTTCPQSSGNKFKSNEIPNSNKQIENVVQGIVSAYTRRTDLNRYEEVQDRNIGVEEFQDQNITNITFGSEIIWEFQNQDDASYTINNTEITDFNELASNAQNDSPALEGSLSKGIEVADQNLECNQRSVSQSCSSTGIYRTSNGSEDEDTNEMVNSIMQEFELRKQSSIQKRKIVYEGTRKQADKMIKLSEQKFSKANVGDTVCLRIPAIDRSRIDFPNMLAIIMDLDSNGLFKLGSKKGVISGRFERKEFDVCKNKFLRLDDVPEKEICVRKYSQAVSMFGGQGHKHCNCVKKCDSNRCICKKSQEHCNSRCHPGNSTCKNKE